MKAGERVFYFQPKDGWEVGIVRDANTATADLITLAPARAPAERLQLSRRHVYAPVNEQLTQDDGDPPPDDLLELPELHLAILLHTLRRRHAVDMCYTYIGDLVVALNPFRYSIPHYQESMINRYLAHTGHASIADASHRQLQPHPWALAHRTFHNMQSRRRSQTIVISGESGSGKTEACKMLLHYLCLLSGRVSFGEAAPNEDAAKISARVHQSNPILEAFGNAKTARNDNSSRFGKLMEVQFDDRGALVGMRITAYLLEKLRVVTAAPDERIYHAFYLLASGAPAELRHKLRIISPRDFRVLNAGGCVAVRSIDEVQGFADLAKAFVQVGFEPREVDAVWRVVAAILHLQNVKFTSSAPSRVSERSRMFESSAASQSGSGEARIEPDSVKTVEFVATELLQIDPAGFKEALVSAINVVRGETVVRNLSVHKADEQRDTLCKHLYAKLFFWIVERVNENIAAASPPGAASSQFIALLDIFGFEDFHDNSLEQLCINLANEALQRHYAKHVFERDRDEVTADNVVCDEPDFRDNQPCLDLIQDDKQSIFAYLEDASALDLEKTADDPNQVLLDRITRQFLPDYHNAKSVAKSLLDRHPDEMKTKADFFYRGKQDRDSFTVLHYAGAVKYKVGGFVEKNTDVLKDGLINVLLSSEDDVMRNIVGTAADGDGSAQSASGSPSSPSRFQVAASPVSPRANGGAPRKKINNSAVSGFRASLAELLRTIDETQPSWVRCIRPHPKKQPGAFDGRSVLEQIVATGILETIHQRQRNFPFRIPLEEFAHRYGFLASGTRRIRGLRHVAPRRDPREVCAEVVAKHLTTTTPTAGGGTSSAADAQTGRTKVFLRAAAFARLHAEARRLLREHVLTVQRFGKAATSARVSASLRFADACARCGRVFRLHRALAKLRAAALEAVRRAILARLAAERLGVERDEAAERRDALDGAEARGRAGLMRPFLSALLPLIAAVLENIQRVEGTVRGAAATDEATARASLAALARHEAGAAAARTAERLRAEEAARRSLSSWLLTEKSERAAVVGQAEAEARDALRRQWAPVHRYMAGLQRRAALLREHRDAHVKRLERLRDLEVERLATQAAREVAGEAARWRAHVGEMGVRRDCERVARLGLSPEDAAAHLTSYYSHGGPSLVLSPTGRHGQEALPADDSRRGAAGSGRHRPLSARSGRAVAAATSAPQPSAPNFIGVRSYAEYASRWRSAFAASAEHDQNPLRGHRPQDGRYPQSSDGGNNGASVRTGGPASTARSVPVAGSLASFRGTQLGPW